jgi:hypothetical protein
MKNLKQRTFTLQTQIRAQIIQCQNPRCHYEYVIDRSTKVSKVKCPKCDCCDGIEINLITFLKPKEERIKDYGFTAN